jgi:hypothetical protein
MRIATIRRAGASAVAHTATLRVAIGEPADAAPDPELRLAELARSRAPLRRALARIAGRFVVTRASDRLGFARLGDWARERVGLSARQIQDLARVDEKFGALPRIEAAFVRGDLTWSKTRLLVGVARAEDADRWVAYATRVTVHALERQVRALEPGPIEAFGVTTDEDGADDEPSERISVACAPRVRAKFHRAREMARRVAGEALSTWACMEAVAAEALSVLGPMAPGGQEAGEVTALSGASWSDRAGPAAREDPPLPARAGPPIASPDGPTNPVAGLAGAPMANVCPTPATEDRPLLARVATVCAPPLPSWVRLLVEGIDEADAFELDDRAAFVGSAGLPERQTCAQAQGDPDARAIRAATNGPEPIHETARIAFVAPRDAALFLRSVVLAARARLQRLTQRPVSAGEAIEWMLDHAFAVWGADDDSLAPEHRVFERDGWRCTVPGCSSYRNLHDHHIVYRSRGGSDDLRNRTTLCACHHQRGVHGGLVRCTGSAPDELCFELGLRAGRPPLVSYVVGERRAGVTRVAG